MENLRVEWKRQWRDDFLKNICGLANADGGVFEIGRDDNGLPVGIDNAKKLLEDLPNIIRQALGIVPTVELVTEKNCDIILVRVDASSVPVSYHGRHYIRSGSTTQELMGIELDYFIMKSLGKTWDGIVVPKVEISDLDLSAIQIFRESAIASNRLQKQDLEMSNEALLDSLSLLEDGKLTRAGVLLFHPNPEKYIFGSYVKVGLFENNADLLYQDEFRGPLISIADRIVDVIYLKYLKGLIRYEGILRITDYLVPYSALREAIFNAMVHRDYTTGVPIQIKIYSDSVTIYNDGRLPENWTVVNLFKKHRSRPYNPKIAYTFYRAGFIETWGRGIERMTRACLEAGKKRPEFDVSFGEVSVTFFGDSIGENGDSIGENNIQSSIVFLMNENPKISAKAIASEIGIASRNIEAHIQALKKAGKITREGSAKGGCWRVIE